MKKIQFDIKYKQDIIDGKFTVLTAEKKLVEIIKWDAKGHYPIVGLITLSDGSQTVDTFSIEGRSKYYELFLVPTSETNDDNLPSWEYWPQVAGYDYDSAFVDYSGGGEYLVAGDWRIKIDDLIKKLPRKNG